MDYQLVLQFNEDVFSYDDMISFENELEKNLEEIAEVDGHDFGSGELNFFILTNNPKEVFDKLLSEMVGTNLQSNLRAAFRQINEEHYYILWPKNLTEFKIA